MHWDIEAIYKLTKTDGQFLEEELPVKPLCIILTSVDHLIQLL